MRRRSWTLWLTLPVSILGCTTTFQGLPNVPDGPAGCKSVCEKRGMELTGMVATGEYSDGCICQVPGKAGGGGSASAAGPAVAGVWIQM